MNYSNLSPEAQNKLNLLVDAFLRENEKINLSSIRNAEDVREKHLNDSLAAAEFLQSPTIVSVLDIGTGGGFPLLPLAIAFPEKVFVGLDSVGKKLAAVDQIAKACGILSIKLLNGRAEELGRKPEHREKFDAVTARAVAKFPVLIELASPFIRPGGVLVCYRGPEFEADDEALAQNMNLKIVQKYEYKMQGSEKRVLWIFKKVAPLSAKWPRATGIPKQKPLKLKDFLL